ncbi:SCO family protein [Leptolyngbya sp. 15MV]|nr:SCO family protein [Leptolyngbya sp. 15MV]
MLPALRTFAAALALSLAACSASPGQPPLEQAPLAGARIGGDFTLTGSDGQTVRWNDFAGQWRIVYFGFAFCPDICPTDMSRMTQGLRLYAGDEPELAERVVPIFITIDPERDTPENVGQFVAAFSDKAVGLTGTPEAIKAAARRRPSPRRCRRRRDPRRRTAGCLARSAA